MTDKCTAASTRPTLAFFAAALAFLAIGVVLGLYMSASDDHSLAPVHAHTNLLGWVSCAIMGLFYGQVRPPVGRRFMQIQFWTYTGGVMSMMVGLAGILKTNATLEMFIGPGVGLTLTGIGCFAWAVFRGYKAAPLADS